VFGRDTTSLVAHRDLQVAAVSGDLDNDFAALIAVLTKANALMLHSSKNAQNRYAEPEALFPPTGSKLRHSRCSLPLTKVALGGWMMMTTNECSITASHHPLRSGVPFDWSLVSSPIRNRT
jgi:hypothetical protein